jgi:dihydroxyacetone kinase
MDQLLGITAELREILAEGLADVLAAGEKLGKEIERKRVSGKVIHPKIQGKAKAQPNIAPFQRPTTKPALSVTAKSSPEIVFGRSALRAAKKHVTGTGPAFHHPTAETIPIIRA